MIVIRRAPFAGPPATIAVVALLLLSSCDNPHRAALRELDRRGIPANAIALAGAANRSDLDVVDLLLSAGVYPDHRDALGRTPLFYAIEQSNLGIAFRLINAGADPDAATTDGTTLISLAVARREIAIADHLLRAGAWPGGRMPDGGDLVPWAIRHGRIMVLDHLFEHGGLDPNQRDATGTPLAHVAFQANRPAVLAALLTRGADPSAPDPGGTPLAHAALDQGDLDLVNRLLDLGADPGTADANGRSLLVAAIEGGHRPLFERLLGQDHGTSATTRDGASVLIAAIQRGWNDLVPTLVSLGADPNRATSDNRLPLDFAMTAGDTQLVTALVRLGARPGSGSWNELLRRLYDQDDLDLLAALLAAGIPPTLRDHDGRPIVEAAFATSRPTVACLFLRYGANPGDALYQACERGDAAIVSLLLDHHCPTNPTRAPWLDTPLAAAVRSGYSKIAELLLRYGAHPEIHGLEQQRPLVVAAILGHGEIVGLLLDHGAEPEGAVTRSASAAFVALGGKSLEWTLKRDERVRPIMLAAHSGDVRAIRELLEHGAKRNCYTRYNKRYPINFASRRSHVAAMRLLLGKDPVREERRIVIDLSEQQARVFDPRGQELFVTKVSTGKKGYATPQGEYVITNKYRHWTSTLYHASMPYFQRLSCGDFGLHQGYVPGYPASHGCIRVPSGNASRLFKLTALGDRVQIVE